MDEKVSKSREDYLKNLKEGLLVAFKMNPSGKVMSAMVKEVEGEQVKVETKNGSVYFIKKSDIAWVKTGKRWPGGIFNALRDNVNQK